MAIHCEPEAAGTMSQAKQEFCICREICREVWHSCFAWDIVPASFDSQWRVIWPSNAFFTKICKRIVEEEVKQAHLSRVVIIEVTMEALQHIMHELQPVTEILANILHYYAWAEA